MNEQILHFFNLTDALRILPLTGGGNNRVFKVEFASQSPVIVKQYFSHPQDPRPRLLSEFSFLQYAREAGIRNVPEPIAFSNELNAAVYSFIPGRAIQPSDISDDLVHTLIDFFVTLNKKREINRNNLSFASEACLSIDDYLAIVDRRLKGLQSYPMEAPLASFLNDCLLPKWIQYKNALSQVQFKEIQDFCISPSDFGFHNALINDSNEITFIDFEYAGMDDPCKTVCDLFCQPKIPLPKHYFPLFAEAFSSVVSDSESCLQRIHYLFPAIQMKWCCILLNVYTKIGKERRTFSHSHEIAHAQLVKAKQLFSKIKDPSWPT